MQIVLRDAHRENAAIPISLSFESASNVTIKSDRQLAKQDLLRRSTEFGLQIDESDEHP
jgi:hypothetical protein